METTVTVKWQVNSQLFSLLGKDATNSRRQQNFMAHVINHQLSYAKDVAILFFLLFFLRSGHIA
jgi:hypothetical protein